MQVLIKQTFKLFFSLLLVLFFVFILFKVFYCKTRDNKERASVSFKQTTLNLLHSIYEHIQQASHHVFQPSDKVVGIRNDKED